MMLGVAAFLVAATSAAVLAGPVGGWRPTQTLAPTGWAATAGVVGIADDGQGVAVTSDGRISYRDPVRPWSATQMLGSLPQAPSATPALAMTGSGAAVVVWQERQGTSYVLKAAFRAPSGRLGAATPVLTTTMPIYQPGVVLSPSGRASIAVRVATSSAQPYLQGAIWVTDGTATGGFGPGQTLSTPGADVGDVLISGASDGEAVLAWSESTRPVDQVRTVLARTTFLHNGVWGPVQTPATGTSFSYSALSFRPVGVGIAATGAAVLVAERDPGTGGAFPRGQVELYRMSAAGSWGAVQNLPRFSTTGSCGGSGVAVDDAGRVTLVYECTPDRHARTLYAASGAIGSALPRPAAIRRASGYAGSNVYFAARVVTSRDGSMRVLSSRTPSTQGTSRWAMGVAVAAPGRSFGSVKVVGGFTSWGGIDVAAARGRAAALVASDVGRPDMTWRLHVRE